MRRVLFGHSSLLQLKTLNVSITLSSYLRFCVILDLLDLVLQLTINFFLPLFSSLIFPLSESGQKLFPCILVENNLKDNSNDHHRVYDMQHLCLCLLVYWLPRYSFLGTHATILKCFLSKASFVKNQIY